MLTHVYLSKMGIAHKLLFEEEDVGEISEDENEDFLEVQTTDEENEIFKTKSSELLPFFKSEPFFDPGLIDLNSNITQSLLDSSLPLNLKENNKFLAQCSSLMSIADSYNKTQPTNSSFITTSNLTIKSTLSISANKFFKALVMDTVNPAKAEN